MKGTLIVLVVVAALATVFLLVRHHVVDLIERDRARVLEAAVVGASVAEIDMRLKAVGRRVAPDEAHALMFGKPPSTTNVAYYLSGISMIRVEGNRSNRVSSIEVEKIEWR